jgi:hypothetical protein
MTGCCSSATKQQRQSDQYETTTVTTKPMSRDAVVPYAPQRVMDRFAELMDDHTARVSKRQQASSSASK